MEKPSLDCLEFSEKWKKGKTENNDLSYLMTLWINILTIVFEKIFKKNMEMREWFHQVLRNSILDSLSILCRSFSSGSLRLKSIKLASRWLRRSCKCWPVVSKEIRLSQNWFFFNDDLRTKAQSMVSNQYLETLPLFHLPKWFLGPLTDRWRLRC